MGRPQEEISAGGVVIRPARSGHEVLIADQRDWNSGRSTVRLPKGHLEPGETLAEAALREVKEEVGVEARILQPLSPVRYVFWHRRERRHVPKVVHYFLMSHVAGDPRPVDGEMERVRWCSFERALVELSFESERGVVRDAWGLLRYADPNAS